MFQKMGLAENQDPTQNTVVSKGVGEEICPFPVRHFLGNLIYINILVFIGKILLIRVVIHTTKQKMNVLMQKKKLSVQTAE